MSCDAQIYGGDAHIWEEKDTNIWRSAEMCTNMGRKRESGSFMGKSRQVGQQAQSWRRAILEKAIKGSDFVWFVVRGKGGQNPQGEEGEVCLYFVIRTHVF